MSYNQISHFGHSSDIFNTKELNKPEVPTVPKRQRQTNVSSDIIAWSDPVKQEATSNQRKKPLESNTMKSSVFSHEPLPQQRVRDIKGAQTTFVLGTDDTSIYNVKKPQPTKYDPNKYYKESTAYERIVKQLYGDEVPKDLNKKSCMGTLQKEEELNDNPKSNCMSAKERKFQMFYNNNKVGNKNFEKPDPFLNNNSTGTKYDGNKKGVYNHVEYLKSNIFNDPDKEDINNKVFAQNIPKEEEKIERPTNIKKRNMCKDENDVCFAKLDWRDANVDKYFKKQPDKVISETNAKQRKLNELYGKDAKASEDVTKADNDQQFRKNLEFDLHNEHPQENEAQIKKRIENLSAIQGKEFVNETSKYNKINNNRKCQNYEIKNFSNINQVNVPEIEKLIRSKGMHVYGVNTEEFYVGDNQKGRIVFSLRENEDGNKFDQKVKEIKDILKKEQGLDITEYKVQKKKL